MEFMADKIKIYPPLMDGTIKVTFETGEYMAQQLQELFPYQTQEVAFRVTVTPIIEDTSLN